MANFSVFDTPEDLLQRRIDNLRRQLAATKDAEMDTQTDLAWWKETAKQLADTMHSVGWVRDADGNLVCPWCKTGWASDCPETCSKTAALTRFDQGPPGEEE